MKNLTSMQPITATAFDCTSSGQIWCEGEPCSPGPASAHVACWVGCWVDLHDLSNISCNFEDQTGSDFISRVEAQARKKKIAKAQIRLADLRAQTRGATNCYQPVRLATAAQYRTLDPRRRRQNHTHTQFMYFSYAYSIQYMCIQT